MLFQVVSLKIAHGSFSDSTLVLVASGDSVQGVKTARGDVQPSSSSKCKTNDVGKPWKYMAHQPPLTGHYVTTM